MRLVSLSGVANVLHPIHGAAEADTHGIFDLTDTFAATLLADAAHWREESAHLAHLARVELATLTDPGRAAKVLAELRDKVASLEATVATLTTTAPKVAEPAPVAPPADIKTIKS